METKIKTSSFSAFVFYHAIVQSAELYGQRGNPFLDCCQLHLQPCRLASLGLEFICLVYDLQFASSMMVDISILVHQDYCTATETFQI